MVQQGHEGTKQLKIEDMSEISGRAPMSARARIAAENPATHRSPAHEERMRASYEAARKAAEEAKRALEEASKESYPEEKVMEAQTPVTPSLPEPQSPRRLEADLSKLVYAGCIDDEIVVAGFAFRMKTLSTTENNAAVMETAHINDNLARIGAMRVTLLSRAIVTVNGIPVEGLYNGDPGVTDRLARRKIIIGSWQQALVTDLFIKYTILAERSEKVFEEVSENKDALKN